MVFVTNFYCYFESQANEFVYIQFRLHSYGRRHSTPDMTLCPNFGHNCIRN